MKRKSPNRPASLSRRRSFPENEARIPWLPKLLDAFAIIDTGVAIAIRDAEKKEKKRLACREGCDACCHHHTDIPLYPHELVGLYWYASEMLAEPTRGTVREQLAAHRKGPPCPFLVDRACAVHPVRPVACRQFNVFTGPCAPGEDPYFTRRHDVLTPLVDYTDRAFALVVPFYQLAEPDVENAIRLIKAQIMNLQEYEWKKLAEVMDTGKA